MIQVFWVVMLSSRYQILTFQTNKMPPSSRWKEY